MASCDVYSSKNDASIASSVVFLLLITIYWLIS
jgi:hypothetical protein